MSPTILAEIRQTETRLAKLIADAKQLPRYCPWCKEAQVASAFTRASRKRYAEPPCDACYLEVYPRRLVPCAVCGERVDTNGHAKHPTHRRCRTEASC